MAGYLSKGNFGMNKIVTLADAEKISQNLKQKNKKIVIAGGCFDILHIGHIRFFEKAKQKGDYLFILLESDENVRKLKGKNRPINPQSDRAEVLSAISFIDYVVLLNEIKTNDEYDNLIYKIRPAIIATTKNDPQTKHNLRQAKKIDAKVAVVTERIKNKSTTLLAKIISENFER